LEQQVHNLASQLAEPRDDYRQFDQLNPRLAAIEQSLNANQDAILVAARQAAEDVIASAKFHGQSSDGAAALALANDLKALEILARKSDERNSKTFEAIHDTLLKIVDRLNTVETNKIAPEAPQKMAAAPRLPVADYAPTPMPPKLDLGNQVPSMDAGDMNDAAVFEDFEPMPVRSPAEAALAAAKAAKGMSVELKEKPAAMAEPAKGGFLSNLTKSLRKADPKSEMVVLPGTNLDPALGDLEPAMMPVQSPVDERPQEASAGTPDLNAIMKRVRDERKNTSDAPADETAKADFLAAARRAAKAAAADVEILRGKSNAGAKKNSGGIAALLQSQRKPIMIVAFAAILALTGLQLSKAFLSGPAPDSPEISESAPATLDMPAAETPAAIAQDDLGETSEITPNADALPAGETAVRTVEPAPAGANEAAAPAAGEPETVAAAPVAQVPAAETVAAETPVVEEPKVAERAKVDAAPQQETAAAPAANALPVDSVGPIALREAAAKGDSKALFEVATRYADGRGTAKNAALAAEWFKKAADTGFAPAQFRIGSYYEKGIGVERSPQKAKELYQLSAEQGNASAMHNLAVLHAMGAAGPADNDSAAQWFIKAAEFGVKDSQFNLGILYAKGLGVKQNLEESYKWFALAAKAGDTDAGKKRDEIAQALRPEQLQKARATAELWKAKPVKIETNIVDVPDAWKSDSATTAAIAPESLTKAIRNIQAILNQNGFDAGAPDGKMGGKTKKAIAAYQKANGMPATGEVDEALINSLLKKVNPKKS
jgi:localization factor PodJL